MSKTISKTSAITVREAVRIIGTWTTHLYMLIDAGKLHATKEHGRWLLDRNEVVEYARQLRAKRKLRSDVLAGDGDAA